MARSEPQINLRIPAELKDLLDRAAAENKRSLTAEVVGRLEGSFAAAVSDVTANALTIRLAELEVDLHVARLEGDGRLLDAHYAAGAALEAVQFNKVKGLARPLDAQTIKEVQEIYRDAKEILDDQSADDIEATVKQLKEAHKRLGVLKPKRRSRSKEGGQ
jgi:uncharacterized protein (DUF1778 family)